MVLAGAAQDFLDVTDLYFGQAEFAFVAAGIFPRLQDIYRQVLGPDQAMVAGSRDFEDCVFQFAYIARPGILGQQPLCFRADADAILELARLAMRRKCSARGMISVFLLRSGGMWIFQFVYVKKEVGRESVFV